MEARIESTAGHGEWAGTFGAEHFGGCRLSDQRLTDRAVITANALLRHPNGSLPAKLPKAQLLGYYGFANNPKVNHDNLQAAHVQRTRQAMAECPGVVLVIHDPTEADFSGLDVAGLGQIGNGSRRGFLVHYLLAVDYARHEVLGLAGQIIHRRRKVPKNETLTQSRQHPERESRLWPKGAERIGRPPPGVIWVNLMDRGGDSFESLERQHSLGQGYVVRSRHNRNVIVQDAAGRQIHRKLHTWARKLPALATRQVEVSANANQPAGTARVMVAAGAVQIPPPHVKYGEHGRQPLSVWVVHVQEIDAPAGVEALEWFLLSNVPTAGPEAALERVDWYACRPMVEEFHKAQKTGCDMEQVQFTTPQALKVHIGMISVVAVQLLRLRDLSRSPEAQQRPASQVVQEDYVEALSLWRYRQVRPELSVKDFLYALARLGGHLGRPSDRPPGWLVLWRGWMQLQPLVDGLRLARLKRSG